MLMDELEKIVSKGELTATSLDAVNKITHSLKSLCYIMEQDDGYSNEGPFWEGSMARGRRRDSRGRFMSNGYSRNYSRTEGLHGMIDEVQEMITNAPTEAIRQRAQSLMQELQRS